MTARYEVDEGAENEGRTTAHRVVEIAVVGTKTGNRCDLSRRRAAGDMSARQADVVDGNRVT